MEKKADGKSGASPFVCGYSPDFWSTLIKNLVLNFIKLFFYWKQMTSHSVILYLGI